MGNEDSAVVKNRRKKQAPSDRVGIFDRFAGNDTCSFLFKKLLVDCKRRRRPASWLESHIHGLGVLGSEGHFLILFAQLFLHEGQSVVAWRKALDLVLAIRSGDGVEGALT